MKKFSSKTIQHIAWGIVSSAAVGVFLFVIPNISFAAKAAPSSGAGGMPYQAPLQPLPHGVGANFSNNIQQTENSGPPDSAATVPPVDTSVDSDRAEDILVQNASTGSSGNASSRTGRIVLWLFVFICLAGLLGWLWFATSKHASKQ